MTQLFLSNRWYLQSAKTKGLSFGLFSAGDILLLPLSPQALCLAYDSDVYSVPHKNGWVEVRQDSDVEAFNEHQFLNCRANIFVQNAAHSRLVHESFLRVASHRLEKRYVAHYAILDRRDGNSTRYRVVNRPEAGDHKESIVHTRVVHARPMSWPKQISWRQKGFAFTNGTGVGYVRRAWTNQKNTRPFRKELTHSK